MKLHYTFNGIVLFATLAFTINVANAESKTITFDDLGANTVGSVWLDNGYEGLNWGSFALIDGVNFSALPVSYVDENGFHTFNLPQSGYQNGVISKSAVAFNVAGFDASFGANEAFSLDSLYLTAAWRNSLNVEVTGYSDGLQKYSTLLTISRDAPTLEVFNWTNVNFVTFHSFGGISNGPFEASNGVQFALDNVTISDAVVLVPEPESFAMLLAGLGVIYYMRRGRI